MAAALYGNLHIWSTKDLLSLLGKYHPGVQIYHEKGAGGSGDNLIALSKRQWVEGRGINWTLPNRRPEKLKESLQELEELLKSSRIAALKWKSIRDLQLLFSSGTLVTITIAFNFADIERITIDKSLANKIVNETIHCAIIEELYMVWSFSEKSKVAFVYFGKRSTDRKEGEKLSSLEPKLQWVNITGQTRKPIDPRLTVNTRGDLVCVWWPTPSEAAWPLSRTAPDLGHVNIVALEVTSTQLDVVGSIHTELDPFNVAFSFNNPSQIFAVESSQSSKGKYTLKNNIYECQNNKIQPYPSAAISIKGRVTAQGRNHKEDKLLVGCANGELILFDSSMQRKERKRAGFLAPSSIAWHPNDGLVLVANSKGDIQIFDMALTLLAFQLSSDFGQPSTCCKLGQYFFEAKKLEKVSWSCDFKLGPSPEVTGCYDDLLLVFEEGLLCVIRIELGVLSNGRLGPVEIVSEYIQNGNYSEAVKFLNSMNWNTNGNSCFACLTMIIDNLFRLPFTLERETCMEDALGSFYVPTRIISDEVLSQFRDQISRLARRFFHHLLRHKRFEKAFALAVDIGAKDLFMDIHYFASDVGNKLLADAAKQNAIEIHREDTSQDVVLDEPFYSSDEGKEEERFIVDESFYYGNNFKGRVTNFLYEPTPHQELQNRQSLKIASNLINQTSNGGNLNEAKGNSKNRREAEKPNERKYGMMLPSTSDREKKSVENDQNVARVGNKVKNERVKQDDGERSQKGEKKFEIINFGLV